MRKMRKLLLSLLLFPLALISCGKNKHYGHYAFQMGSDKGTHFGVYVDLTQEDYPGETPEDPSPGKTFKLGMKVSDDIMPLDPWDDPEPTIEKTFLWFFLGEMVSGLRGYYSIGDKTYEELGKRLYMTIMMEELPIPLPLPESLAEQFIVAYWDNKEIKLILPVSLKDIQHQLAWYGLFIQFYTFDAPESNDDIPDIGVYVYDLTADEDSVKATGLNRWKDELKYPTEDELKKRIGTHPSEDDVERMNDVFGTDQYGPDIFHQIVHPQIGEKVYEEIDIEIDYYFRDFNTLTVELLKE